jgi:hypothetical protein
MLKVMSLMLLRRSGAGMVNLSIQLGIASGSGVCVLGGDFVLIIGGYGL